MPVRSIGIADRRRRERVADHLQGGRRRQVAVRRLCHSAVGGSGVGIREHVPELDEQVFTVRARAHRLEVRQRLSRRVDDRVSRGFPDVEQPVAIAVFHRRAIDDGGPGEAVEREDALESADVVTSVRVERFGNFDGVRLKVKLSQFRPCTAANGFVATARPVDAQVLRPVGLTAADDVRQLCRCTAVVEARESSGPCCWSWSIV